MTTPLVLPEHEAVADAIRSANDWYEAGILRAIPSVNRVIVDVGAHIGNHSVYWLRHGARQVWAFEPMPQQFAYLTQNLMLYGEGRSFALQCALTDSPGLLPMEFDPVNWGRSCVDDHGPIAVPATTLDAWDISDVSLIKVDVEGWQAHVLAGAAETIDRWRPDLLVEDGEGVVLDTLLEFGFRYVEARSFPNANSLFVPQP